MPTDKETKPAFPVIMDSRLVLTIPCMCCGKVSQNRSLLPVCLGTGGWMHTWCYAKWKRRKHLSVVEATEKPIDLAVRENVLKPVLKVVR